MKEIPLGGKYANGAVALVDDRDYEAINQYHWFYVPPYPETGRYSAYAYTRTKTGRLGMHTFIMQPIKGMETDHHNQNGLDNQRSNLRNVTSRQNCLNRRKKRGCSSPYKGVTLRKGGNFEAHITHHKKILWIGEFKTEHHAALAYDLWATYLHGEYALLNFKPIGGSDGQVGTPKRDCAA